QPAPRDQRRSPSRPWLTCPVTDQHSNLGGIEPRAACATCRWRGSARAGVAAENPNTASVPGWSSKVCAGASRYATRNEARAAPVMRLRPGRFDTWVRAFRQGLDSNPSCYTDWLIQRDVGAPEHDPADP